MWPPSDANSTHTTYTIFQPHWHYYTQVYWSELLFGLSFIDWLRALSLLKLSRKYLTGYHQKQKIATQILWSRTFRFNHSNFAFILWGHVYSFKIGFVKSKGWSIIVRKTGSYFKTHWSKNLLHLWRMHIITPLSISPLCSAKHRLLLKVSISWDLTSCGFLFAFWNTTCKCKVWKLCFFFQQILTKIGQILGQHKSPKSGNFFMLISPAALHPATFMISL